MTLLEIIHISSTATDMSVRLRCESCNSTVEDLVDLLITEDELLCIPCKKCDSV